MYTVWVTVASDSSVCAVIVQALQIAVPQHGFIRAVGGQKTDSD